MPDMSRIRGLARVAGLLCSAHEELEATSYPEWAEELRELVQIIASEIDWLENRPEVTS
jgi:hypothetical protein